MSVLVDTSVWIDFLQDKPRLPAAQSDRLERMIRDDEVSCVEPIRAEILSGRIRPARRGEVTRCLEALVFRRMEWGERKTWDEVVALAALARSRRLPSAGLVDRMIIVSAARYGDLLWTTDRDLAGLARAASIPLFDR